MKAQTFILIPIYHSIFKHISNFTLTVFIEYSGGLMYAKSFSSLGVQYVAGSVQRGSVLDPDPYHDWIQTIINANVGSGSGTGSLLI